MRNNQPVTQNEYVLKDGQVLVSETDLLGNITYTNDAFIEVSGYSREELIGQPHNMIRHPDVPAQAFKDLWETLSKGEPWHFFVKNRRKNGDYYWVEANIAPVMIDGKVVGYKSVRNKPTRDMVAAAEAGYQAVHAGAAFLKGGVPTTPRAEKLRKLSPLPQNNIMKKLMIPLVLMAIVWSVILQFYLQNVADDLYLESMQERSELLVKNLDSELAGQAQIAMTNAVGIAGNSAVIYGLYDNQQTVIWQILQVNHEQYVKRANMDGMGLAVFDAKLKEVSSAGTKIHPASSMPSEPITKVTFQEEGGFMQAWVPVPYGDKVIGLVVVSLPLTQIASLEKQAGHEYGVFSLSSNKLTAMAGFKESAVNKQVSAIDVTQLQQKGYFELENDLIVFSAVKENDQVIGAHLISEPKTILTNLLDNTYFMIYVAQIALLGGFLALLLQIFFRSKALIFNPLNALTQKLKIAADQGSLSVRADVLTDDEIGQMGSSFNHYLTAVQHLMITVSDMVDELSKGRLDARIEADAKGDLDNLKMFVNESADNIQGVMLEIESAIHSIKESNYDFQSNSEFSGDFKIMFSELKDAMSSTSNAVDGINQTMSAIAQGDFSQRLNINLSGELEKLKHNLNQSLDMLEAGITETVEVVVAQSEGDLTNRIQGSYGGKIGVMKDAVNTSLENMERAVSELYQASNTVNEASVKIAEGSSDISERIQNQASTLQETVSSMEMITEMVKRNAENANEATKLAGFAKEKADVGHNVMDETNEAMKAVSASSQKISDIIGLIDSIAFQTNLLALNAAVEAARAGEHGRGFAVVAGEVRNLAGKSADAAKEIRDLIEQSAGQVARSESLVSNTSKEFNEIVEVIMKMHNFIGEIATANREQSDGVNEITNAMEGMDQTTQQNAALVEQTAHAAEALKSEADDMKGQVGFFHTSQNQMSDGMALNHSIVSSFQVNHGQQRKSTSGAQSGWSLAVAKRDLRNWVNKLQAYLNDIGTHDRSEFTNSTGFTNWLETEGKHAFANQSEFALLEELYPTLRTELLRAYDLKATENKPSEAVKHFIVVQGIGTSICDLLGRLDEQL